MHVACTDHLNLYGEGKYFQWPMINIFQHMFSDIWAEIDLKSLWNTYYSLMWFYFVLHKTVNNYVVTLCFGSQPEDGGRSYLRRVLLYYDTNFNTSDKGKYPWSQWYYMWQKNKLNVSASRSWTRRAPSCPHCWIPHNLWYMTCTTITCGHSL